MKTAITESDKKLLGYLAAFLIAVFFIFCVFKPLIGKNRQIQESVKLAKEQQLDLDNKAALAADMQKQEEAARQKMGQVLSRFYPMLQSQKAESMVTTLLLNHGLSIQSLNIIMPEKDTALKWYQYSEEAKELAGQPAGGSEEQESAFLLYSVRISCVAEGSNQALWDFIDDVSENYPAISIVNAELSAGERMQMKADDAAGQDNGAADENTDTVQIKPAQSDRKDRLSISLEIFMCSQ